MKNVFLFFVLVFALDSFGANISDNTLNLGTGTGTKRINFKGTPGYIGWDSATSKAVFSNDGTIAKALGSGVGGGAGAFSVLENPGFEDGITIGWSSTVGATTATSVANALFGTTSAVFDPTLQNDFLRTIFFTTPKGIRGTACEARFRYTGGLGVNLSARVTNEAGIVLGSFNNGAGANVLPQHSLPDYESIFYKCPTEADITTLATNGNVRLEIYQGTTTNAVAITVDDAHLGSLIGLVDSTTPDMFVAVVSNSGNVSGENVDWINGGASIPSAGVVNLTINSGLITVPMVCTATSLYAAGSANTPYDIAATTTLITVRSVNMADAATTQGLTIHCHKGPADAKQSVQVYRSIPKVSANVNEMSFGFDGGASIVTAQVPGVLTGCTESTGVTTCTIAAGVFTTKPGCHVSLNSLDPSMGQTYNTECLATTTQVQFKRQYVTGSSSSSSSPATVTLIKAGVDYKLPTVQPVIIGQVTNSAAETSLTNVRTESCRILNSGTASIDTTTGLCAGWVQSVSRTGAGQVTVTLISGIFATSPICAMSMSYAASNGIYGSMDSTSVTNINMVSRNATSADALTDAPFTIICMGRR